MTSGMVKEGGFVVESVTVAQGQPRVMWRGNANLNVSPEYLAQV